MGRISKFEKYVLQDEREGKVVPQKQELGSTPKRRDVPRQFKKKKGPPHLRSQHCKLGLGICILLA